MANCQRSKKGYILGFRLVTGVFDLVLTLRAGLLLTLFPTGFVDPEFTELNILLKLLLAAETLFGRKFRAFSTINRGIDPNTNTEATARALAALFCDWPVWLKSSSTALAITLIGNEMV